MFLKLLQTKALLFATFGAIVIVSLGLGLYFGLKPSSTTQRYGAVTSNGYECAKIGADVLKENGSAMDAAIAVLFCEGVAVPQSMGLGGGFFMTIYTKATGHVETLNAREVAPIRATANMFVGNVLLSQQGGMAAAVPGELKGYWEAHQKYGKLPWRRLIEPSIELGKRGSVATAKVVQVLKEVEADILQQSTLREVFMNPATQRVWGAGDFIKQVKLAESLEVIAREGADALYSKNGSLLRPFLEDVYIFGGIMTEDDFLNYRVIWEQPLKMKILDDMTLYTMPPPASGIVLTYILQILSHFNLDNTGLSWHRVVEAFKFAYAKRTTLGDPAFVDGIDEILANMTSLDYIKSIYEQIDDTQTFQDYAHYGATFSNVEDHGTAHIAIVAPNGDAVSVTSTINYYYGALRRSPKTGIILNNEMDDFSTPGIINLFGVPASPANFIAPGKQPMSSMAPSIIVNRDGDVRLVIGAAGGTKITTSMACIIIRHLYLNESITDAINTLRIHHQLAPMSVDHEEDFDESILRELSLRGHRLRTIPKNDGFAAVQAIARESDGSLVSSNDYRRGGSTMVFSVDV